MSDSCSDDTPSIILDCADPAYRAAHPDECSGFAVLLLIPEYSLVEPSKTVSYTVILRASGREIELENGLIFSTSNPQVATIGPTGIATGVTPGTATISVTWQDLSAHAQIDVIASCAEVPQHFAIVIDNSSSMNQLFSSAYATKLSFSKQTAYDFAGTIMVSRDDLSVWEFSDAATERYALGTDIAAARAQINSIAITTEKTDIAGALQEVIDSFPLTGTRVIVLFTDFEWTGVDPHAICEQFKSSGGFLVVVATESWGEFFQDAAECASAGFLLSAYDDTEDTIVPNLLGLKSFVCNSGCNTDPTAVPYAELNYLDWINFTVTAGRVDLIGNGVWDVKEGEGRGLYADMSGTGDAGYPFPGQDFGFGKLTSKVNFSFEDGKTYSLAILQGGSVASPSVGSWTIKITAGDHVILPDAITVGNAPFAEVGEEWTQVGDFTGPLIIEQLTQSGHHNVGTLIDEILLRNETDDEILLEDDFDSENPTILPINPGYYQTCLQPGAQTASPNPPTPRVVE